MDSITKEIVREYKQNLSVMTNEEFCKEWASVINNLKSIFFLFTCSVQFSVVSLYYGYT